MQSNIIDFGVKRAVREMDDVKIQNFLWYFENYRDDLDNEIRDRLQLECQKEAQRRGLIESALNA